RQPDSDQGTGNRSVRAAANRRNQTPVPVQGAADRAAADDRASGTGQAARGRLCHHDRLDLPEGRVQAAESPGAAEGIELHDVLAATSLVARPAKGGEPPGKGGQGQARLGDAVAEQLSLTSMPARRPGGLAAEPDLVLPAGLELVAESPDRDDVHRPGRILFNL